MTRFSLLRALSHPPSRLARLARLALVCCAFMASPHAARADTAQMCLPPGMADYIIVEKAARRLTLYNNHRPIKSYEIALGWGGLGPKREAGDGKTPEGVYHIAGRNDNSHYHHSLRISYPDAIDIALAAAAGKEPGGDIMIHGSHNGDSIFNWMKRQGDWTNGCIAVKDDEIDDIAARVSDGTLIEIKP